MTRVLSVVAALGALACGCGDPGGPPLPRVGVAAVVSAAAAAEASAAAPLARAAAPARTVQAPARPDEDLDGAPTAHLVAALRAHPAPDVRRRAVDAYARRMLGGESAEPLIEACAADADPLVRRWAALALADAPAPELRPRLAQLAASERDATVRSILERGAASQEGRR